MKTILITGSSRGIGKAIAVLAHEKGYQVIVHGRSDSTELQQLHIDLNGSFKTFFDIADKQATHDALTQLLKKVQPIDVLVNNAGVALNLIDDISEMDDKKALTEYSVNVLGTLHCIQEVLPNMMEAGKGSIINISSIKGVANLATTSTLTYATTKAGVISLTKALAKTYPLIRFNAVIPGYTDTDQVKGWNQQTYERINKGTLLGRVAQPKEIAPLVLFLASDDASYITGSEFYVDGGYAIKGK